MNEIQNAALLSRIRNVGTKPSVAKSPVEVRKNESNRPQPFDAVLDQASVQFSKHAEKRLESRNIDLNSIDRAKLSKALGTLQQKGARDSLVVMGENAFIVNVPTKTVVTAIARDQMQEQVFTNIDSTLLV